MSEEKTASKPGLSRSPALSWAWALVWFLVALATSVNAVVNGAAALAGELSGTRTAGLVLLTPLMALILAGWAAAVAVKTAPVYRAQLKELGAMKRRLELRREDASQPAGGTVFLYVLGLLSACVVAVAGWNLLQNLAELPAEASAAGLNSTALTLAFVATVASVAPAIRRTHSRLWVRRQDS